MLGAFFWAPRAAQEWTRYSIPYRHNKGWSGDAKYRFVDPNGNSSASYNVEISSYNGLVVLDNTTQLSSRSRLVVTSTCQYLQYTHCLRSRFRSRLTMRMGQ